MITQEDLQAAIAECQGVKHPNAKTCIELAAFLTIYEHLYGSTYDGQSYDTKEEAKPSEVIAVSDSDFSAAVSGKPVKDVLAIMDECMDAISVLNPRLYAATMRKLNEI